MAKTAGIDWAWKAWAISGFASTSTLASSTAPLVSSMTLSSIGPSVRHGPHHDAQSSTTTGTLFERSMTSVANVASETSFTLRSLTVAVIRRRGSPSAVSLSDYGDGDGR